MTKRKGNKRDDGNKNRRRTNDTAHVRAMAIPAVQEQVDALRTSWNLLSPAESGEQLNELLGFGCSASGLAKELRQPLSTILRYIRLVKREEEVHDYGTMLERISAKTPKKQTSNAATAVVRQASAVTEKKKEEQPVTEAIISPKDQLHPLEVQQPERIAPPSPTETIAPAESKSLAVCQDRQVTQASQLQEMAARLLSGGQPSTGKLAQLFDDLEKPYENPPEYGPEALGKQGRPIRPEGSK